MWFDELLSEPPAGRNGNNLIYAGNGSREWTERQHESIERYADESYEEDPTQGQMFGNFIATGIDREDVVLDIGSGLFPDLPHYVAQLGLKRFLAIEPLTTPVDRSYPCLVGAVAERIPLKDGSVDAVLFATSLDHIEAEDEAIEEVKRVLKPGGGENLLLARPPRAPNDSSTKDLRADFHRTDDVEASVKIGACSSRICASGLSDGEAEKAARGRRRHRWCPLPLLHPGNARCFSEEMGSYQDPRASAARYAEHLRGSARLIGRSASQTQTSY